MSAQPHPSLTPEEYLTIERAAELKSEFYDGRMYAMSGGSYPHGQIILNLGSELRQASRSKGCSVTTSDVRLRVSPRGFYTYPDIAVVCGPPKFADDQADTLLNPTLLVEVLSPLPRPTTAGSSSRNTASSSPCRSTRRSRKPSRGSKSSAAKRRESGCFQKRAGWMRLAGSTAWAVASPSRRFTTRFPSAPRTCLVTPEPLTPSPRGTVTKLPRVPTTRLYSGNYPLTVGTYRANL